MRAGQSNPGQQGKGLQLKGPAPLRELHFKYPRHIIWVLWEADAEIEGQKFIGAEGNPSGK